MLGEYPSDTYNIIFMQCILNLVKFVIFLFVLKGLRSV